MLTRFAPSPTGYLHLGHALAASEAFSFAPCLLRIEDIDSTRCKPEFTQAIYEDLQWLGFNWAKPARIQSAHLDDYKAAVAALETKGLLYRCFRSRKELGGGPAPLSEREEAENLAAGKPFAWRLSIDRAAALITGPLTYEETGDDGSGQAPGLRCINLAALSDTVVARKDISTSYHIAVTHDDNLQGITHVVRGADLAPMTDFHVLLQTLMGWTVPIYHHHRLVLDGDGEKLAKGKSAPPIRTLRAQGISPEAVLEMARFGGPNDFPVAGAGKSA